MNVGLVSRATLIICYGQLQRKGWYRRKSLPMRYLQNGSLRFPQCVPCVYAPAPVYSSTKTSDCMPFGYDLFQPMPLQSNMDACCSEELTLTHIPVLTGVARRDRFKEVASSLNKRISSANQFIHGRHHVPRINMSSTRYLQSPCSLHRLY